MDGFANVIVHAGIEADLAILVEGIRRHGQNGNLGVSREGANRSRRLDTVQAGHLHIHQDQGVGVLLGQFECLQAS